MKIAILGYSGAGKSTLARIISEKYNIEPLHFDTVQFLPDWEIRSLDEKQRITKEFLDSHNDWVIDGNYSALYFDRRLKESNLIILMLFNRFSCLWRAYSRYIKYKNMTRPDMAEGCNEKFDYEFFKWIMYKGRKKSTKERYARIISEYREKTIIIKNQKQLDSFLNDLETKGLL